MYIYVIYVHLSLYPLLQRCTTGDKDGDECLYLNEKQKTELYYKKNKDGAIIMIAAVDYKKVRVINMSCNAPTSE